MLFVHGLLGSSQQWLANGPGKAWGLEAAETGLYDAWFVNLRGNRYSREHIRLEADSDTEFWDFSFEEFGTYDLPAAIKAIQAAYPKDSITKKEKKVALVTYSEGSTSAFYALSMAKGSKERDYLEQNVSLLLALGPITQMT